MIAMLHRGSTLHIENNSCGRTFTPVSITTCFWNLWFSRTQAHLKHPHQMWFCLLNMTIYIKKNVGLESILVIQYELCNINDVYNYTFVNLMLTLLWKCLIKRKKEMIWVAMFCFHWFDLLKCDVGVFFWITVFWSCFLLANGQCK